jgi:hypothetical protein
MNEEDLKLNHYYILDSTLYSIGSNRIKRREIMGKYIGYMNNKLYSEGGLRYLFQFFEYIGGHNGAYVGNLVGKSGNDNNCWFVPSSIVKREMTKDELMVYEL